MLPPATHYYADTVITIFADVILLMPFFDCQMLFVALIRSFSMVFSFCLPPCFRLRHAAAISPDTAADAHYHA